MKPMRKTACAAPLVAAALFTAGCGRPPSGPARVEPAHAPPVAVQVDPDVSYILLDGEERNRESPDAFPIPPRAEREDLHPGQVVELMFDFESDDDSEVDRVRVTVDGKDEHGYVGKLDEQPPGTPSLKPGDEVHFRPEHVVAIREKGEKPAE